MKKFTWQLTLLCILSTNCFADSGWLFQPLYTQGTNDPTQTSTAGNKGSLYFNNTSSKQVYIKLDDYPTTNWLPITQYTTPFFVTCTANSATATTVVHCLPTVSVGAAQVSYLSQFHAQVNGSTGWTTTTSCAVQDTTGAVFLSITNLSANAYLTPSSPSATRSNAYSLGAGSTPGAGLDLVCSANGSGSPLVVTLFGVIQNP